MITVLTLNLVFCATPQIELPAPKQIELPDRPVVAKQRKIEVKSCDCSSDCVCGCQDGEPCSCGQVPTKEYRTSSGESLESFTSYRVVRSAPVTYYSAPVYSYSAPASYQPSSTYSMPSYSAPGYYSAPMRSFGGGFSARGGSC